MTLSWMAVLGDRDWDPTLRLRQLRDRIRSSLWFAPAIAVAGAIAVASVLVFLDRRVLSDATGFIYFEGGPESARELLSAITTAMLTFTALVFSITILALQLASNQLSPRAIRTFLQEKTTKLALATFVGTFVYAMAVLSRVRTSPAFVPSLATWAALVLVLASVAVFIKYIHQMSHSVRAITVITKIADETRRAFDRTFPEHCEPVPVVLPAGAPDEIIRHTGPGAVITFVDEDRLVSLAKDSQCVVELVPRIGDFVPTNAPLLCVWGSPVLVEPLRAAVALDIERTIEQDPAFGFRQLVDIAVRSLSPGINDPSTAVQAIDHLHDLLRRLTTCDFPSRVRHDDQGQVRVFIPALGYDEYVRLAVEEIREYGHDSIQVSRKLEAVLADCASLAPPERRAVLHEQLRLLRTPRAQAA